MIRRKEIEIDELKQIKSRRPINWYKIAKYFWAVSVTIALIVLTLRVHTLENDFIQIRSELKELQNQVQLLIKRVAELEINVQNIQERVVSLATEINHSVDGIHEKIDQNYKKFLEESSILQAADSKILATISSIMSYFSTKPDSRAYFGLGCWPAGTKIDIDSFGNYEVVEKLGKLNYVWCHGLGRTVNVKMTLAGPETGFLWKFTTSDHKTVYVTETHPMIFNGNNTSLVDDSVSWQNVAARDISIGDWTWTVNGKQQIIEIQSTS